MKAKTWQDTVITHRGFELLREQYEREEHTYDFECYSLKAQAKATWNAREPEIEEARKAGIKEVVDWLWEHSCFPPTLTTKLKEGGIDVDSL